MEIKLRSPAFGDGQRLAIQFTADGANFSPALSWDEAPLKTREWALTCEDPDAPGGKPWVHWLLYKMPADTRLLNEAIPGMPKLRTPPGAMQGRNSWTSGRTIGYRGPAPPLGKVHRYRFRIYALDASLDVDPGIDHDALLRAMHGHILAEGTLTCVYGREE